MQEPSDIKDRVVDLLRRRDDVGLRAALKPWLAADVAPILADLSVERLAHLFRVCPLDVSVGVFGYLAEAEQLKLLKALPLEIGIAVLNELPPDDRTEFLDHLPPETAEHYLGLLRPEERKVARELLSYPEHSVGRMMTLDYVAVRPEWTVREALRSIRVHGYDRETLNVVFVVDDSGKLLDDVRVRRFLLSDPDLKITDLMDGNVATLAPTDDRETALQLFQKLDRAALPVVVEPDRRLVGIVTADDMLDVAAEEATEDIQKLGGTEAFEEPYTSLSIGLMIRKRAVWLVVLLLGEMLTATAIGFFEEELARAVVLATFIPLIISAGGNAGSQAASLVIRALALGELSVGRWWLVMRRELLAGIALGLILGVVGFLRIAVWSAVAGSYGAHGILLAWTVGGSLVGVVAWGSLTGSMFPLLLHRLGFDPATSSAPFVATLVDVTGIAIYFGVAFAILSGTVL